MSSTKIAIVRNAALTHTPRSLIPRPFSTVTRRQNAGSQANGSAEASDSQAHDKPEEESAMQRRLAEMTEQAMLEGGRSASKNMEDAGFSEDLKKQLQERLAATEFKNAYPAAHSIINMPVSCDPGSSA